MSQRPRIVFVVDTLSERRDQRLPFEPPLVDAYGGYPYRGPFEARGIDLVNIGGVDPLWGRRSNHWLV
ncbi:MAG: hypothetical protein GKS06_20245 [Acidobacteria bacterium]|nr:hypothetical protein [Acidobacteriota bacterium]